MRYKRIIMIILVKKEFQPSRTNPALFLKIAPLKAVIILAEYAKTTKNQHNFTPLPNASTAFMCVLIHNANKKLKIVPPVAHQLKSDKFTSSKESNGANLLCT